MFKNKKMTVATIALNIVSIVFLSFAVIFQLLSLVITVSPFSPTVKNLAKVFSMGPLYTFALVFVATKILNIILAAMALVEDKKNLKQFVLLIVGTVLWIPIISLVGALLLNKKYFKKQAIQPTSDQPTMNQSTM